MALTSNPAINQKIEKLISPNLHNPEEIFSQNYFKQRLLIEKRRTERLNTKAAIVLVGIGCLLDALKGDLSHPEHQLKGILKLLSPKIRMGDVVCLYEKNIIAFLLPDTNFTGAEKFWARISEEMVSIMRKYHFTDNIYANNFEMEILTYPENKPEMVTEPKVNEKKLDSTAPDDSLKSFNSIAPNYQENLNVGMYSSNGFSIVLPFIDSIFWDDLLFSSYIYSIRKIGKRIIDIFGSLFGILLLSPLLLAISILIKVTSPGPIFYQQERIGFKGNHFKFWKFRSMKCNCDATLHMQYVKALIHGETRQINNGSNDKPFYKITKDPRVTPLGQFLRDYSLDELPQLWNVLKGEMSIVGPRPPIPYEVNEYKNWHYRRLTAIKPGITGLWQIYGRNKTSFDDMVRLDIHYVENWTLWMDIKIIFKTFTVLHQGK